MIEVLEGGIQTTVQDFPGRQGLLDQGICPAGPFDNLAVVVSDSYEHVATASGWQLL